MTLVESQPDLGLSFCIVARAGMPLPIKTGAGRITGYLEVFCGGESGYVTVPGSSQFRDA
jgi:hypothetical protein